MEIPTVREDRAAWPRWRHQFCEELERLPIPHGDGDPTPVHAGDIAALPEAARRYFARMGALDRPRDWSLCAHWAGRFRRTPEEPWRDVEAWQYNSAVELARVFHMRFPMGGVIPVYVRDTYVQGRGRMLARALDLIPVVDGAGDSFDLGELVTWLNDAVFIAPSMLLRPEVEFFAVDDGTFDLALTDREHTVRARVYIDEHGAPVDFHTTDRYVADPFIPGHPITRAEWSTPMDALQEIESRTLARHGKAVWKLRGKEFVYAELTLVSAQWNLPPGA